MNLNGTESLIEMDWKNLEKDWKCFDIALKIWQKNTCGRTVILGRYRQQSFFKHFLLFKKAISSRKV